MQTCFENGNDKLYIDIKLTCIEHDINKMFSKID